MADLYVQIVDALNALSGAHSGYRAAHARGVFCAGSFTATPDAAGFSRAAHLSGAPVDVTARFSNGSGNPGLPDADRTDGRGLAIKFHLPGGEATDIVAISIPLFFVRTPEDFLAFLEAQRPDPTTGKPDLDRVSEFVGRHPETQGAIGFVMFSMAPASFAGCTFHGIHAFRMTASDGRQRYVRYRWIPDHPWAGLSQEETRARGTDYLHEELEHRLAAGPVAFGLWLQIAAEDDDPADPTVAWPEDRELVHAGRLVLTEFIGQQCNGMIFDPTRVVEGIDLSDDPILHARRDAYSVSFARRTSGGG